MLEKEYLYNIIDLGIGSRVYMNKNKIIIILVGIIYVIGLVIANVIFRNNYDKLKNEYQGIIIYGKESHEELFKNNKGIKSYSRLLTFTKGEDNEVVESLKKKIDENGLVQNNENSNKITWDSLSDDRGIVLTFRASVCDLELNDDEVVIIYHSNIPSSLIGKEMAFMFNDEEQKLTIKDINDKGIYNHICISNNLYDELVNEEVNYIYDIKTKDYKTYEYINENWRNLENNDFYGLSVPSISPSLDYSFKENRLSNIVDCLNIINLLTIILGIIMIVVIIVKGLVKKSNESEM